MMRKRSQILVLLFVTLLLSLALSSLAFASDPPTVFQAESPEKADVAPDTGETEEIPGGAIIRSVPTAGSVSPFGGISTYEVEPNDTPATANPLSGSSALVSGYIWPVADLDYFSFSGNAGDRVYAATMTSFAAGATDTTLTLFDADGTTIIEVDVNDGSFAASSSSIAGATLPANGTYYLQVRATSAVSSMRPYHLYFQLRSGSPTAETEPNNLADGGEPLPPSGWVSGAIDPAGDNDRFNFSLNAGDTVFLSLDLDPERDGGTTWNGRLGLGAFGNPPLILVVNDANTTSPNSEAFFFTVKESGTYYAYVDPATAGTGDPNWTYNLSVSVFPHVPATASCTTYTSANVPVAIPAGPGLVTSTLTVPGNPLIADLDVTIVLTHTNMPDLDVVLMAPGGNQVVLFNDLGVNTQQQMNLTLDDEAAIPMGSYTVMSGMVYQPPATRRLDWFDGQNAGGVWTLMVYDDLALNDGVLQSWSITVCEPPPPPSCPVGYTPVTVFSSDFEADDGGFTSSGVQNEWQWGQPNFAPITTCNSGANCWVTDLTGTYNASSNQNLLSPPINLSGYLGPIILSWTQKHQIENANWDNAFVDVQQVGGANPTRLWEWLGPTMSNQVVGSPTVTIPQGAGWGEYWADISGYAGQSIEARFNLSSDSTVNFAGLAIDDVTITACQPPAGTPFISLDKTVGTDSSVCATGNAISIGPGEEVTYCYEVTNTGTLTLTLHSLEDDQLGSLLNNFPYSLSPGASAFITASAVLTQTTSNLATWTAFNAGPTDVVSDTASATVTVVPPSISLNKTVGLDPSVCATTDVITVQAGTEVVYCYEVTNTGLTTLGLHDLMDSELGSILDGFAFALAPGASVFLTQTAVINTNTTNSATWTAYNAGPTHLSTATDTASVIAIPAGAFCNTDSIAIPGTGTAAGPANPYPSSVLASGLFNSVTNVQVYLLDVNHTWPNDIDIMLVGPQGQNLVFMSDAGGSIDIVNVDLVFDDAAPGPLPQSTQIFTGIYQPTNYPPADPFPAPAPPPSAATQLAVFNGSDPNGTWDLFVYDDTGGDIGNINGGWCLFVESEQVQLPPNIDVDPLSLSAAQPANATTQQTLTISNTGEADLTWAIAEEPAAPAVQAISSFSEGFEDITILPGLGWFFQNNSSPLGTSDWFQGNTTVFSAHQGPANSYVGANFNNTANVGTISNWGLTPVLSLADGDTFSFWTRVPTGGGAFPDRLEVRLSTNGSSTNVGTLATDVGDFTNLLLSVNPDLTSTGYPEVWTQFTVTLSDIPSGATGRIAFRYFVTNGGPNGSNSNYIGIDTVEYVSNTPSVCDAPADVPWLSVSPANGTTAGGSATPVQVTFDSTGLEVGVYNANLCVTSNDPNAGPGNGTDLVIVPVELAVEESLVPSIAITKTVGTEAGVCAATDTITVMAGTNVYYCYTVTNTGNVTLNLHDLEDDELGDIFAGLSYALAPGSSVNTVEAGLAISATITADTTNTATWTAYNDGPVDVATATASATVTVIVYRLFLPVIMKP